MSSVPVLPALPLSRTGATVSVRAIQVGSIVVPASIFFSPVVQGYETEDLPVIAYLIEHGEYGQRVMFDLGTRTDIAQLPPSFQAQLKAMEAMGGKMTSPEKDVATQLREGGIDLESVKAVVWSHYHMDHTGDMSTFPSTTELVIHEDTDVRTYPSTENSTLLESDFANHPLRKLSFTASSTKGFKIGDLDALDYFGDGSFYILDTPGHCPGHVSALARVTPASFTFLGGDCCHHVGDLRPTVHHHHFSPCPLDIVEQARRTVDGAQFPPTNAAGFDLLNRTTPMLEPGEPMYDDYTKAKETLEKIAALDAHPDVLTLLPHDASLIGEHGIDLFPASVDDWQAKGSKEMLVWGFMKEGQKGWRFGPKLDAEAK
ncbi:Metallo-hydrolase/oxidoreductase [Hymenopellis radicata]|nr:Metallo-hydrolase/oxidoreductase [Hymenopellis radicata]